ncbi:MAG TPA: hypothetical protein VMI31_11170, partial [Fimbriimonadaceae bacterium]|nr:hypothetical protein [Fimbriimonadaceae bacterium]
WVVETQTVPPYATAVPGWLSGSWSPLDFLGGMSGSDIVFYSGHGAPDNFLCGLRLFGGAYTTDVIPTGPDVLCPQSPNPLMDAGLESRRIDQIGSGAPPFNSTGNPPVNFVFLQACDCLQSAPWMKFLYPYAFQYGSYLEDQAVLGFACAVRLGEYWNEAGTLFSDLMSGMTVDNARTDLLSSGFHNADNDALLELRDVPVIGDTHTRTRTVYTGDNSSPGTPDWFLPLPPTVPGPTGG